MDFYDLSKIEWTTVSGDMSPETVLRNFDLDLSEKTRKRILDRITKIDHIGILVSDINIALKELNSRYPEARYQITKQFDSVGIPKNYEGSTAIIVHIQPKNIAYPKFEFFVVNWGEMYRDISNEKKKKFIEHTALNIGNQEGIQEVMDILRTESSNIEWFMPLQTNESSGEIFTYFINKQGIKVEIVYHIQSTTDSSQ